MKKWLAVGVVLVISAVAHGVNMRGFPYWENDEGVYVAQAWAVRTQGQLSHYTYWYDHAPAGWLVIAGWQMISGLATFGSTIDSGRVLMWMVHIAASGMLLVAARRLSGKNLGGYLAVLVFSLSPLAIYFQRRVLLDNMMVWWVLVAWVMVLGNKWKLWTAIAGGAIFGWAVLTKEVAVYFLPGMLYTLAKRRTENRPFVVVLWLTVAGLVVGSYFLLAGLKGELWPAGWGGSGRERVSLLGSLTEQLGRGKEAAFWQPESLFYQSWQSWMHKDELMVIGGVAALVIASGLSLRVKHLREVVVMAWGFGVFLLRSKLVFDFYVVPLIPFTALAFGLGVEAILSRLGRWKGVATAGVIGVTVVALGSRDIGQYSKQETGPQRQAVVYIKERLLHEAVIVADNSIWLDLKGSFPNIEWAWKVEKDKDVFEKKLQNDWRNIDYVVVSHEILKQIRDFEAKFIKEALDNSREVAMWTGGSTSYLDIAKYISTNGDWMGLYRVNDKDQIALDAAWREYKKKFMHEYGQVIDPQGEKTTSEGQAYAMLRAVWQDDRETFEGLWEWTRDHLQFREQDKLFSWWWGQQTGVWGVVDAASAADADVDIAWALSMAANRWKEEKYLLAAKEILKDIWKNEVVVIGGKHLLVSGSGAKRPGGYLVNPSYFSPAAYRSFQKIDAETPWEALADDSYWWLGRIKGLAVNQVGLVPNWVWVSEVDGSIKNAPAETGDSGNIYGFDAFRIYWRAAVDAMWYGGEEAGEFLGSARDFWAREWRDRSYFAAEYDLEGNPAVGYGSLANTVGPLAVFKVADPELAQEVYSRFFDQDKLEDLTGYWGEADNYYDQNWGWFGTALFTDGLPNL